MTGELGHAVYGGLTFEDPPQRCGKLEPLAAKSSLERLAAETVNDAIPVAKVGPSQAQDIVRTTLGAKPAETEPETPPAADVAIRCPLERCGSRTHDVDGGDLRFRLRQVAVRPSIT